MNADFETRLRSIEWSALNHAYGDAGDVPDALLALFDRRKAVREDALRHLRHSINHQGFPENATPVAIPFLLEILQTPGVQDRDKLLDFFSELSQGQRLTKLGHIEEMHRSTWQPEPPLVQLYEEIYDLVCQGIPVFVSLLDDSDEAVVHQALYLLAWLAPAAPALLPRLRTMRQRELSDELHMGVSIAVGLCLLFLGMPAHASDLDHWRGEIRARSRLRRFGAAVGTCYAGEAAKPEVLAVLGDALASMKNVDVPWNNGHLGTYVGIVLSWLTKARGADVVHLYQQVLEEKAPHVSPRSIDYRSLVGMWPELIAAQLLTLAFEKPPTKKWPAGYTPLQRWILRFLARHPNLGISEGYCSLREQINQLNLPHPTKKGESLRLETLEDIGILTSEEYPPATRVLHRRIYIAHGSGYEQVSMLELWERAVRSTVNVRRKWLIEICVALSNDERCTFLEELLARPGKTHRLDKREAETLSTFVELLIEKPGMVLAAKKTALALVTEGCLRYPLPSRLVFATFAEVLLRLSEHEEAIAIQLLKKSPQYFEHQDTDVIRGILGRLPEKERGEVIDALHIRSFAEPNEAWSLYDLALSEKRAKILLKSLREYPDFFAGPGAFRFVTLISSMPLLFLPMFVAELHRPRASKRGYAFLLAAAFSQHEARETLLRGVETHRDPRVPWIAEKRRRLTKKELLLLEIDPNNKTYTRAKGGVIGANGKPWDGSMPRYRRKRESISSFG